MNVQGGSELRAVSEITRQKDSSISPQTQKYQKIIKFISKLTHFLSYITDIIPYYCPLGSHSTVFLGIDGILKTSSGRYRCWHGPIPTLCYG